MATKRKNLGISKEFPGDQALQQVHLARKTLQEEAKRKGMSLGAYVRSLPLHSKTTKTTAAIRK
jgi:hypothetical protein